MSECRVSECQSVECRVSECQSTYTPICVYGSVSIWECQTERDKEITRLVSVTFIWEFKCMGVREYGVATISRLLRNIGLFCRIQSLL